MQLVNGYGTQCKHHDKFLLDIFGNLVFISFSHRLGIFVFFSIRNNFVFFSNRKLSAQILDTQVTQMQIKMKIIKLPAKATRS